MNKTVDKVGENLEENAIDLNLNKLGIGSALLNIARLNTDISKTYIKIVYIQNLKDLKNLH